MRISVITPTYNRRHTLDRLWQSLLAQKANEGFEWILVDDGSSDGTKAWFDDLQITRLFKCNYVYQPNQGKHVAINTGVSAASGDWVLILDSDDALTEDAIHTIETDLNLISRQGDAVVGYGYRKEYFAGGIVGRAVATSFVKVMTPNEAGALFKGDLAYLFKRECLVRHSFPVIANEKFVPELLIWNRISDDGDIPYHSNKAIYLCEYLPDGYSANFKKMLKQNPEGFGMFYLDQMYRLRLGNCWFKAFVRFLQCQVLRWLKS